jgi:hypothetical protein
MPLSREDADDILIYLRERVRSSRLAGADQEIIRAALDGPADRVLIRYIDLLSQTLAARGAHGLGGSLGMLNTYVRTERGERIHEIEVVFDQPRARAFGTDSIILQSDRDLRQLAEHLAAIRDDIVAEGPPEWRPRDEQS